MIYSWRAVWKQDTFIRSARKQYKAMAKTSGKVKAEKVKAGPSPPSRNKPNAMTAKGGATSPGETVCHGPTETLGKAGPVSSSLCKWAGTRSVQELLCAQRSSGVERIDRINVWESVRREEGCHAGWPGAWCTSCTSLTSVLEKVQEW